MIDTELWSRICALECDCLQSNAFGHFLWPQPNFAWAEVQVVLQGTVKEQIIALLENYFLRKLHRSKTGLPVDTAFEHLNHGAHSHKWGSSSYTLVHTLWPSTSTLAMYLALTNVSEPLSCTYGLICLTPLCCNIEAFKWHHFLIHTVSLFV